MHKSVLVLLAIFYSNCIAQTKFNGGFEKIDERTNKPVGWSYGVNKDRLLAYPVKLDSLIKNKGEYSVSIEKKEQGDGYGSISYAIAESYNGRTIELAGYIKTETIANGFAGLWLRLNDKNGQVLRIDNMQNQALNGTNDWKKYTIKLAYGSDVSTINFGGLMAGDGKAWFDDFEVSIDGKKIESLTPRVLLAQETDTAYVKSSGIQTFVPAKQQVENIAIAAQFWGFLKYHHPSVAKGDYDWDAELFRFLPSVVESKNNIELSKSLENYLDNLPSVQICKSCSSSKPDGEIKPNYGVLFAGTILSNALIEKLKYILKNSDIKENHYVTFKGTAGNPLFKNENAYTSIKSPDAGYRLLALYRYWNMVNYFFPYRDVIGQDWNEVLKEMIPEFLAADSQSKYAISALKMFAKINDTHAYFTGLNDVMDDIRGKNTLPLRIKFVQEKLIIYDYFNDADSIKSSFMLGDEIVAINGETVGSLIKKYEPLVAASNYDTKLRGLPLAFLARSNDKVMNLVIRRDGKITNKACSLISYNSTYKINDTTIQPYKIIDGNIGYVYPGTYKNTDLKSIEKLFENTKGMVIDLRCYPSDFMPFTFGEYIKQDKTPFVKFTTGSISHPGTFKFAGEVANGGNKKNYKNKIVVIVDETTQSNAEYTTMAFQGSPNVKVVGSQTAGADGNVSKIILPGGISSWISGIGIFYPDGTPTQRVGVKIDYPIKPTMKGIRDGKDELLEKALALLDKGW